MFIDVIPQYLFSLIIFLDDDVGLFKFSSNFNFHNRFYRKNEE